MVLYVTSFSNCIIFVTIFVIRYLSAQWRWTWLLSFMCIVLDDVCNSLPNSELTMTLCLVCILTNQKSSILMWLISYLRIINDNVFLNCPKFMALCVFRSFSNCGLFLTLNATPFITAYYSWRWLWFVSKLHITHDVECASFPNCACLMTPNVITAHCPWR